MKQLAESGELPDYDIGYSSEKDMVLFLRRTRGDHVAEDLGVYIPI